METNKGSLLVFGLLSIIHTMSVFGQSNKVNPLIVDQVIKVDTLKIDLSRLYSVDSLIYFPDLNQLYSSIDSKTICKGNTLISRKLEKNHYNAFTRINADTLFQVYYLSILTQYPDHLQENDLQFSDYTFVSEGDVSGILIGHDNRWFYINNWNSSFVGNYSDLTKGRFYICEIDFSSRVYTQILIIDNELKLAHYLHPSKTKSESFYWEFRRVKNMQILHQLLNSYFSGILSYSSSPNLINLELEFLLVQNPILDTLGSTR